MITGATLLAFFKAWPAAWKIYEQSITLYFAQQSASDNNRHDRKKAAREAIIAAIMRPGVSDEELKDLRHSLYFLNHK
jgi:hypothetical protein